MFYGSIQIRTDDRDPILAALRTYQGLEFRLSPVINGWVGVYPQHHGQEEHVSAWLAERLSCDVLHLIVHDDDVFKYLLYRESQLVDRYESTRGVTQLELLTPLLSSPEKAPQVRRLLAQKPSTTESRRLEKFARLFGIKNALTSFEDLETRDPKRVAGWSDFLQIPPPRDRLGMYLDTDLTALGILLEKLPMHGAPASDGTRFWFLSDGQLYRLDHPWRKPTRLDIGATDLIDLTISRSGRWAAILSRETTWTMVLVDLAAGAMAGLLPLPGPALFDFSGDEQRIVCTGGSKGVSLISIPELAPIYHTKPQGYQGRVRCHPRSAIIMMLADDRVHLWDPVANTAWTLLAGGSRPLTPAERKEVQHHQSRLDKLSEADVPEEFKGKPVTPAMREQVLSMVRKFGTRKIEQLESQGQERWREFAFDDSGQYLCVATSSDMLYILKWSDMMEAKTQTPVPLHEFPAEAVSDMTTVGQHLFFASQVRRGVYNLPDTALVRVDLASGRHDREFVSDRMVIPRVAVTSDRRTALVLRNLPRVGPHDMAVYDLQAVFSQG